MRFFPFRYDHVDIDLVSADGMGQFSHSVEGNDDREFSRFWRRCFFVFRGTSAEQEKQQDSEYIEKTFHTGSFLSYK